MNPPTSTVLVDEGVNTHLTCTCDRDNIIWGGEGVCINLNLPTYISCNQSIEKSEEGIGGNRRDPRFDSIRFAHLRGSTRRF